jgi:hypothetical protein
MASLGISATNSVKLMLILREALNIFQVSWSSIQKMISPLFMFLIF